MFFEVTLDHRVGDTHIALEFSSDAKLTALVGRSGAGKTTVLNCIAGLIRPAKGRISLCGEALFDSERRVDLQPERRRAGYVFQDARLFPHRKVAANLTYGERLAEPAHRWISQPEVVDLLGIGCLLERWPATLSGGETRRVAIARALLSGPRFLLLDEPLTSLDRERGETLLRLIERIRDRLDVPILLVSHDRTDVGRLAGQIVEMPC